VWEWVRSNADAKAFLEGTSDPWGMKVNPAYQALGLTEGEAPVSFPKADLHTYSAVDSVPAYGTLDMRPYYNSLDETGTRALRADGNVKTAWDPFKLPSGQYVALAPQPVGQRFMLALTDLATAYRYGLDVAQLQGSVAGNYVAPTAQTLATSVESRKATSVPGITVQDWTVAVQDAYPLTEVSYAAVSICTATADETAAYTNLIEWATSNSGGQVSGDEVGQLPRGYYPLTSSQREAALTAIQDITTPADKATRCTIKKKTTSKPLAFPKSSSPKTASVAPAGVEATPSATPVKLFIRQPYYGEGPTEDPGPNVSKILMAGGYIAGIPMLITGFLMQRKYGKKITKL
jgi:hypothetical protein